MTLTSPFGRLSIRRTLATGILAIGVAAGAVAQFGGAEAHAFVPTAQDGIKLDVHWLGQEIYCTNGWIAIRPDSIGANYVVSSPVTVVYTATLFGWTDKGWQQVGAPQSDTEPAGQYMQQLTFWPLGPGGYTVMVKAQFYGPYYSGSWTLAPVASDFWFASASYEGVQYCRI